MNSKNNVLITGATGLIGSFLVMLFLERGHKVYALARRVDNLSAVKRVDRAISFWKQNFDFQSHRKQLVVIEGDLSAVWRIKDFIKKVDSSLEIIHCAAITSLGSSQRYTEK